MGPAVVELVESPALGALYRRAALGTLTRRSGTELPDTTLVLRDAGVDRERLARYTRVCGYRLSDTLPATYPHVLAFPLAVALMAEKDFPFPVIGLVHIANRMEVRRPIDAGERLELTVRAADLRAHERGRAVDIRATASVGDEVVWRAVSTYLRKERHAKKAPETAPTGGSLWRVGREVGTEYAKVSGDHNPIHTSRLAARAFGYPGPIAHGMWSAARSLAALEGRLPPDYTFDVAFRRPLVLPAKVCFTASPGVERWDLSLCDARTGAPHLTGAVTAGG
jgi:acyl dehydratase